MIVNNNFARLCLLVSTLFGCTSMPNSGIKGKSSASVATTGDPGVVGGFHTQGVSDSTSRSYEAIYQSSHPSGRGGVGKTQWTYVRGVETSLEQLLKRAKKKEITESIIRFYTEQGCAPQLSNSNADLIRSGLLGIDGQVRLVLTRITWESVTGPNSNPTTARFKNAEIEIFGSTARISKHKLLSMEVDIMIDRSSTSGGSYVYSRRIDEVRTDLAKANCREHLLESPKMSLSSSGWFNRNGVYNLVVKVKENEK